jgi:hypothetical protein
MKTSLLSFAASSLLAFGCMASGQVHSSASVSAPDLVYISPGVQVIADYDEPVFYTSSYYWRYDGGAWYRSSYHTGGWIRIQTVPVAIRRIETPTAYIHYHGTARASAETRQEPRNDTRSEQKAEQKAEHKEQQEERHEAKAEQKEERKEAKAEQKEERKDAKAEQKEERKEAKAEQKAEHKQGKK